MISQLLKRIKKGRMSRRIFQSKAMLTLYFSFLILLVVLYKFANHNDSELNQAPVTEKPSNLSASVKILSAEIEGNGRLGNQLFLYATFYAFARRNNLTSTAFLSPSMASHISPYFNVPMQELSQVQFDCISWKSEYIPSYPRNCAKPQIVQDSYVLFNGFPRSYKCFHDYLPEIQLKYEIAKKSIETIEQILKEFGNENATTVGVHVRRADYVQYAVKRKFNLPTMKFYEGAMKYFQEKFKNVIFIIASDDTPWCESNFNQTEFNIKILNGTADKGIDDFAVLANCDHLIFGIGTFGVWAGFLNRGQVVYCSDCHAESSDWLEGMDDYGDFVLPTWIGFSLDGSQKSFLKWNNKNIK